MTENSPVSSAASPIPPLKEVAPFAYVTKFNGFSVCEHSKAFCFTCGYIGSFVQGHSCGDKFSACGLCCLSINYPHKAPSEGEELPYRIILETLEEMFDQINYVPQGERELMQKKAWSREIASRLEGS